MDGSDPGPASDPAVSSRGDPPKRAWDLRSCDGDARDRPDGGPKRIKMRDLESVLHSEGIRTSNIECSIESMKHGNHSKEDGIQIDEATSSIPSDRMEQVTTGHKALALEQGTAYLSLGHAGSVQSSANLGCDAASEYNKDMAKPRCSMNLEKENDSHILSSMGLGVDLNVVDVSNSVEHNPFYPYKKLGQVKPADASECGSTTGPLEESEPLKMWKKMKQNGFLSSTHGGIPLPKQRGRQPRKRKNDESKKSETTKREQANRFIKLAAPSGLLSGLDPGIIKHVRNSKQVHSIIEAMVRSEKHDGQIQNKFIGQLGRGGSKETNDGRKDQNYAIDSESAPNQLCLSLDRSSILSSVGRGKISESDIARKRIHCEASTASQLTSEYDNEALALKLSSLVSMGSDNASTVSGDDLSANQDGITSLSLKAATVASQWLELLQLDIKGRLAALRRSKKRVRNVIQTELPYLLSTEPFSNLENEPSSGSSSGAGCSIPDMHVARWRSLFSQMDKALFDEAKHLESWLRQVQEMQLHCEKGLKFSGADGSSQLGTSEESRRSKKPDEIECAVMAAAASIYSTCNLIMTKENVPCF